MRSKTKHIDIRYTFSENNCKDKSCDILTLNASYLQSFLEVIKVTVKHGTDNTD